MSAHTIGCSENPIPNWRPKAGPSTRARALASPDDVEMHLTILNLPKGRAQRKIFLTESTPVGRGLAEEIRFDHSLKGSYGNLAKRVPRQVSHYSCKSVRRFLSSNPVFGKPGS